MSVNLLRMYETFSTYEENKCLLEEPTVSYVMEMKKTFFKKDNFIEIKRNITKSGITYIIGNEGTKKFDISQISKMYINGVETTPINYYKITSIGEYTFKFIFCNLTSTANMFFNMGDLTSIDLSNLDTSNVTDMSFMFGNCSGLTSLDLSKFDTSKVTKMNGMFKGCGSLTSIDVSNFTTNSLTYIDSMFQGCSSLTSIDVSNFNTSNVRDFGYMFQGCSSLTFIDISNFKLTNFSSFIRFCDNCNNLISLKIMDFPATILDLSTDFSYMFDGISTNGEFIVNCKHYNTWKSIMSTQLPYFPQTWEIICEDK